MASLACMAHGQTPNSSSQPPAHSTLRPPPATPPKWQSESFSFNPCLAKQEVSSPPDLPVLLALRRRHAELSAWAADLAYKQAAATAERHALSVQSAALNHLKEKLDQVQDQQSKTASKREQALAQAYEVMQARDAAQIFHHLDPNLVVAILRKMDSRHLAAILATMTPSDARLATEGLAGAQPIVASATSSSSSFPKGKN